MLNIRTAILSVGLVLMLLLTARLVSSKTEVVFDSFHSAASVSANQRQSADLINAYDAPSYRSQFGDCFDVSIRDLAACRGGNQAAVQANHSAVDECFDVSLWEVASCRNASQVSTP